MPRDPIEDLQRRADLVRQLFEKWPPTWPPLTPALAEAVMQRLFEAERQWCSQQTAAARRLAED
jgi:hypothetical protein